MEVLGRGAEQAPADTVGLEPTLTNLTAHQPFRDARRIRNSATVRAMGNVELVPVVSSPMRQPPSFR